MKSTLHFPNATFQEGLLDMVPIKSQNSCILHAAVHSSAQV